MASFTELCSEELLKHCVLIKSSGKKFEPIFFSAFNILQSVIKSTYWGERNSSVKAYQNRTREKEFYINKLLIERLYLLPGIAQVTWHCMFNIFLLALSDFFSPAVYVYNYRKK